MAELGFNVGQTLAESAKGMQEFQETVAAPQALKQAFAGMSAEDRQDPQKQMAALMQAGTSLMSQGKGRAGYEMLKEASALKTASQAQQLNDLKVKTEQIDYAGQLMQSAQTEDDLRGVLDSVVTDPAAKMQVESIMRNPSVTFEQKKKSLVDMSMTAKENLTGQLKAAQLAINQSKVDEQKHKDTILELQNDRDASLKRDRLALDESKAAEKERADREREAENRRRDEERRKADERRLSVSERLAAASERRAAVAEAKSGEGGSLSKADIGRNQRVIASGNNVASTLEVLNNFSAGTTTGFLPDLTSKKGMLNAVQSGAVRSLSSDEAKQMNTAFTGLSRSLASVDTLGLATGLGEITKKMEEGTYIRQGEGAKSTAFKLADIRRIVEESLKPQIESGVLTPKQEQAAQNVINRIEKAIPYTVIDVQNATKKSGAKTIGEQSNKITGKTSLPKTESDKANEKAAAEAAKYGL